MPSVRHLFGLLLGLLLSLPALSQPLTEATARQLAASQLSRCGALSRSYRPTQLQRAPLPDDISDYLFTTSDHQFAIVGGSESRPRLLGYGTAAGTALPTGLTDLLRLSAGKTASTRVSTAAVTPVTPFIKTIRRQEAPFNRMCPYYISDSGVQSTEHTVVGCVATSLEQVLTYYRRPSVLLANLPGWTTSHYTIDTVPAGSTIDYDKILNVYADSDYTQAQIDEVARLSYWCGVAAHMNWGLYSSGASLATLVKPMHEAFGYSYVRHIYSSDFSEANWQRVLRGELAAGRPVLFAGYTTFIQGHAFLLDGLDSDGLYHIVWGYGGDYDGYFDLNVLNTFESVDDTTPYGIITGHYCNQEALLLCPDSVNYSTSDTLPAQHRLRVDTVTFDRQPDLSGYVAARLHVSNISTDTLTSSYLLMTYDPADTTIYTTADEVSLAGCVIPPATDTVLTAFCGFRQAGRRVFSVSTDDSAHCYLDTIEVLETKLPTVSVSLADSTIGSTEAAFVFKYSNPSAEYWAGTSITYCLFEGDFDTDKCDLRHWGLLNVPPLSDQQESTVFAHLKEGTRYTLVVRCQWNPALTVQFETPTTTSIRSILTDTAPDAIYDLQGRRIAKPQHRGIYLIRRNGQTSLRYLQP